MKKIITLLVLTFSLQVFAQIPSKCLEIESILVDACGPFEGGYEMLRFKTGHTPIPISSIVVTWPSTTYMGLVQNANTAAIVSSINATIASCGKLIQPPGGIIPAGSNVIFFTSDTMSLINNTSFANLTDTLYAIFQLHSGSLSGIFQNYLSTPGLRSTIIGVGSFASCSDTVTYDRVKLVMQNGNVGAQDGATVNFTWAGAATYINKGCVAPFTPVTINAGNDTSACNGTVFNLHATATGNYRSVRWFGGAGHFADTANLTTTYTPAVTEVGNIKLIVSVTSICGSIFYDTLVVTNKPLPSATYTLVQTATPHYWDAYPTYSAHAASASWNWGDGTAFTSGFYPSHVYAQEGRYNICVTVTDSNGCFSTYCQNDSVYRYSNNSTLSNLVYINVINPNQTTAVKNISAKSEINIYPNPAQNNFTIETNVTEKQNLYIFDINGKQVLAQTINGKVTIDASNLNAGVYSISITSNEDVVNKKLIIVK